MEPVLGRWREQSPPHHRSEGSSTFGNVQANASVRVFGEVSPSFTVSIYPSVRGAPPVRGSREACARLRLCLFSVCTALPVNSLVCVLRFKLQGKVSSVQSCLACWAMLHVSGRGPPRLPGGRLHPTQSPPGLPWSRLENLIRNWMQVSLVRPKCVHLLGGPLGQGPPHRKANTSTAPQPQGAGSRPWSDIGFWTLTPLLV